MSFRPVIVLLMALLGESLACGQGGTVALSLKGTCDLWDFDPAYAWDVSVAGGYAYVACSRGGMLVIDVHDPAQPSVVGAIPTVSQAGSVRVRDRYAFLTDTGAGLQIIDVSEPSTPVLVATWNTVGLARGICLAGDYAYVSTGESALDPTLRGALEIIDVSSPEHPSQAGCFYTEYPGAVDVAGNYAYLAISQVDHLGLQVLDVSNPARPFVAGAFRISSGYLNGVRVIGDYAYVAGNVWDSALQRDVGFLRVLNVAEPTRPLEAGRCSVEYVVGLDVVGNYAYVSTGGPGSGALYPDRGLAVIDVSNPSRPVRVGTFEPPVATHPNWTLAAQVVGKMAYLANTYYFYVAEITFPMRLETTALPDSRLRLSWLRAPGVRLQQTTSLANPNWQDLPDSDGQSSLELPMTERMAFFRLVQR